MMAPEPSEIAARLTWIISARESAERAVSKLRHAERERSQTDRDDTFIATLVHEAGNELRYAQNRCEDTYCALTHAQGGAK